MTESADEIARIVDGSGLERSRWIHSDRLARTGRRETLDRERPDYLLVLPWNILDEVRAQNATLALHGSKFVTAIPELRFQ
jgi:hypothetical protein